MKAILTREKAAAALDATHDLGERSPNLPVRTACGWMSRPKEDGMVIVMLDNRGQIMNDTLYDV